jgi:hypothetical protein
MQVMNRRIVFLTLMIFCSLAGRAFGDYGQAIASAPAAVQATVKKILGDKTCVGFEPGNLPGVKTYQVDYDEFHLSHYAEIAEDGSILGEYLEISNDKVPDAVAAAATKAHPDGTIMTVYEGGGVSKSYYEIELTIGKDTRELKIDRQGTIASDVFDFTDMDPEKVPAAVLDAVKKVHPDGMVIDAQAMAANGDVLSNVGVSIGDDLWTTEVYRDGRFYSDNFLSSYVVKEKIPAAVTDAVKKVYPDVDLIDASATKSNGETVYETDILVGKKTHALRITADGDIVKDFITVAPATQP